MLLSPQLSIIQADSSVQATALKSIKSIAPLLDRILVQRIKAEAKTAGGIYLPESAVKDLNEAKVLAVGPGGLDKEGKRVPVSVAAGDRVLIPTVSTFLARRLYRSRIGQHHECAALGERRLSVMYFFLTLTC